MAGAMILSQSEGPGVEGGGPGLGEEAPKKKHRRNRTTFTMYQLHQLEQEFKAFHYLDMYSHEELAAKVHLPEVLVQVWFQNRQAKWHHQEQLRVQLRGSGSPEAPQGPRPAICPPSGHVAAPGGLGFSCSSCWPRSTGRP